MTNKTSHSLLERAAGPESEAAWKTLVEIYEPFICAVLQKRGVNVSDAEDIAQNVLCTLHSELPRFKHNGTAFAFRSWLRRTTINQVLNYVRSPSKKRKADLGEEHQGFLNAVEDSQHDLIDSWDIEHNQHVVRQLLGMVGKRFNPRTLEAFKLTFLNGASNSDVAVKLGISKSKVIQAKSRVLRALREIGQGLID